MASPSGAARTTISSGSNPPSQTPAASRCSPSDTSSGVNPGCIAQPWRRPVSRATAIPAAAVASQPNWRASATAATASASACPKARCPNSVSHRTLGIAANAWSAPASAADSSTTQTISPSTATPTLVQATRRIPRSPDDALGRRRPRRNSRLPNAESSPATATARATSSSSPPAPRSNGGSVTPDTPTGPP